MDEKITYLINIKKCEQKKLIALASIQGNEIKIMELEDAIATAIAISKNEIAIAKTEMETQENMCKELDLEIATSKEKLSSL
jgi:hypothetical protein